MRAWGPWQHGVPPGDLQSLLTSTSDTPAGLVPASCYLLPRGQVKSFLSHFREEWPGAWALAQVPSPVEGSHVH